MQAGYDVDNKQMTGATQCKILRPNRNVTFKEFGNFETISVRWIAHDFGLLCIGSSTNVLMYRLVYKWCYIKGQFLQSNLRFIEI